MSVQFIGRLEQRPASPIEWVEVDPSANPVAAMACYLSLDPQARTALVWLRHNSENFVTSAVYHGRELLWSLPANLDARFAHDIITQDWAEMLSRICDGYSVEWDGKNHVGRYDGTADALIVGISSGVNELPEFDEGGVIDAADWLDYADEVDALTTDEALEAMAERMEADALDNNYIVVGLLDRLRQIRDGAAR